MCVFVCYVLNWMLYAQLYAVSSLYANAQVYTICLTVCNLLSFMVNAKLHAM